MRIERTNFHDSWDSICPHCGQKQEKHRIIVGEHDGVRYEHRMPCEPEKTKIRKSHKDLARTARIIFFVFWILVPLVIAIAGFANFYVGLILFIYSLFQIGVQWVKLFGNPDKWIPGHKERSEKELRMKHYFYHCEKNPTGFQRLKFENFDKDETEQDAAANP